MQRFDYNRQGEGLTAKRGNQADQQQDSRCAQQDAFGRGQQGLDGGRAPRAHHGPGRQFFRAEQILPKDFYRLGPLGRVQFHRPQDGPLGAQGNIRVDCAGRSQHIRVQEALARIHRRVAGQ